MSTVDLTELPRDLVSEGTSRYVYSVEHTEGALTRVAYRFPNGYGASVVCGTSTYGNQNGEGLFELGVLSFLGGDDSGRLTGHMVARLDGGVLKAYSHDNHDGVYGWLTPTDVELALLQIKRLSSPA